MRTAFHYEPVNLHTDPRGLVLEPLDKATLQSQSNVHLVITGPGAIRGNHYHKVGTEVSVILGPALVRVRQENELKDIQVPAGEAYRFVFPPGLPHAIQNNGDTPQILIAFNTIAHDPTQPDVVRETLISPTGSS